ncbi:hypothetical protein N7528_007589 [Penicillium herquei]|nr:hypothetical protein N7528_007589 [Penicillium herquei]
MYWIEYPAQETPLEKPRFPDQEPPQERQYPTIMLSTESLSWRSIQVVKSHLAGRLARFTRSTTPETRPQKRQNDVAFFEADLRFVLTATPMLVDFSEHEFSDMDRMTRDLLTSLNDMVNEDVISPGALEGTQISPHDMSLLSDKYPRLTSLIAFLDKSTGNFNLTTGTGSFLFILPPGRIGSLAIEQINEFKAFLERLTAKLEKSQDIQMNPQLQKKSSEKVPPHSEHDMHRKRASLMINALFEEFRELGCREMHEVKLRVSHDWQTGNCDNTLDIFLSSCPDPGNWQQAKCGTFQINIDKTLKDGLCDAIQRARQRGIILCLFVDQGGLFDISDKMPPIMSALHGFSSESLGELLDQKAFIRMTPRDYLKGIVTEKFDSREKATLALSLARCLMEFFNEDLELASYSWKPESIYFLRSTAAHGSSRDPYISLRPKFSSASNPDLPVLKTIRPGNPILLSFARLLLEIDSGEKIPITIHAESRANVSTWGRCVTS